MTQQENQKLASLGWEVPVVFVGENNPYGADPRYALYDAPVGCAGARLRQHLGIEHRSYLRLGRVNLCDGPWSVPVARNFAWTLIGARRQASSAKPEETPWFVLLGRKVALAFDYRQGFFSADPERRMLLLPHPSGRNPMWNEAEAVGQAQDLLDKHIPQIPWGREAE